MEEENQVFSVIVPPVVAPLITKAAQARGWTAQIDDGAGNMIDNPTPAIMIVFLAVVDSVMSDAINLEVNTQTAALVAQLTTEIETAKAAWLIAMQPGESE